MASPTADTHALADWLLDLPAPLRLQLAAKMSEAYLDQEVFPPVGRRADIERAMKDLIAERGCDAADSTIRLRAKKIWRAIQLDEARN
jgi:hypothetical protein